MVVERAGRSLLIRNVSESEAKEKLRPLGFRYSQTWYGYIAPYNEDTLAKLEEREDVTFHSSLTALVPPKNPLKNLRRLQLPCKRKQLSNQIVGNALLVDNDKYALFWQMGTGKSNPIVVVGTHYIRTKVLDAILIVTERNIMSTWAERHIPLDCTEDYKSIVLTGTKRDRELKFRRALLTGVKFFIINYDGLKSIEDLLLDKMDGRWAMVLDESHNIKDSKTARFRTVMKIATECDIQYRWLLSGTPVTQNLEDIFGQYAFLNRGIFGLNFTAFQADYVIRQSTGGRGTTITGYKNIGRYMEKLHKNCHRLLRSDVIDLPEKTYDVIHFDLPEPIQKMYEWFKQTMSIQRPCEIDSTDPNPPLFWSEHPLTALAKARQIVNNWAYINREVTSADGEESAWTRESVKIHEPWEVADNPKLEWICDILEQTGKSMIIWYAHHKDGELIERALNARGITYTTINHATPDEEYMARQELFENHQVQVFIAHPAKAGSGITLLAAELVVYFNNVFSVNKRLQSEDRCHRIGQTHAVTYYDLVYDKTVEVSMKKALDAKIEISKAVVDRQNISAILGGEFGLEV